MAGTELSCFRSSSLGIFFLRFLRSDGSGRDRKSPAGRVLGSFFWGVANNFGVNVWTRFAVLLGVQG